MPVAPLSLPRNSAAADPAQLATEPVGEHRELLAHRRRRRRLAVGVREQRHVAQVGGHRRDRLDERGRARQPDVADRALDHEGVGQVVDVLAGAAEVDQLGEPAVLVAGGDRGEAALEEVLDGLDVVLRLALDLRELGDLVGAEVLDDLAQLLLLAVGERADPRHDLVRGEEDQPLDLDPDPLPVERRLGEVVDEGRHHTAVATVEGAQRDGRGRVSKRSHDPQSPRVRGHLRTPVCRVPATRRAAPTVVGRVADVA